MLCCQEKPVLPQRKKFKGIVYSEKNWNTHDHDPKYCVPIRKQLLGVFIVLEQRKL